MSEFILMEQDKINAYMTLYTALVEICKTAAPMIPFMTEEIYQNLVRSVDESAPESIHLCDFPVVNEAHIDTELEANMDNVLKMVVMGRACRNTANIKNRQPIGQMYVKADFEVPEFYKDIVKDELNVKNVTFTQDVRDFTSYTFKPQLKTVGPKYGKMLGGIKAALDNLEGNAAMDELNATDALKLDINGQEVTLFREDLLIESAQMPGYVSENDNGITVVMDTNLSEELLEEGFVEFFENIKGDEAKELKGEYLLPIYIDELLKKGKVSVRLLETQDKWFGVTYKEDKPVVVESFAKLIADGVYQKDLFADLKA